MVSKTAMPPLSQCVNCGFEAESGSSEWNRIHVPGLGRMTQCPTCDSTNVIVGR